MIDLKIKKVHPDAKIPHYATDGSAGLDLTCVEVEDLGGWNRKWCCHTGLAIEIPKGYVGLLFPRSSISKKQVYLTNSVGVIDSDYRGEITAVFASSAGNLCPGSHPERLYQIGERCCQLVLVKLPEVNIVEVDELSETERGSGGYGSTGK